MLSRTSTLLLVCATLTLAAAPHRASPARPASVGFKKTVLDTHYRAEGVAVADVNRDGKLDLMVGNLWYEAPDWRPHEIAPPLSLDPATDHSNSYLCFTDDLNHDGWPDEILVGRPGTVAFWRENPRGSSGPWPEHPIYHSACNESPWYTDLFGTGKRVLVFAHDDKLMAWYEPAADLSQEWICHDISLTGAPATNRYSHGLGIGDVDGDHRSDVLCRDGYWKAPADRRSGPWSFVPAKLGPDCAQMHVYDVNRDGLPDVITSSAHNIGVWWWEQKRTPTGTEFLQHTIDDSFSQSHSLVLADINGDGAADLVTGKRFWAHGPTGDVRPNDPAVLYWFELTRTKGQPTYTKHLIDSDSGVGTQFTVTDVNRDGLPDIVISNKKGVFLFLQERSLHH